jgi:hypothetical protein
MFCVLGNNSNTISTTGDPLLSVEALLDAGPEAATGGWENTLSKIALNIFASRSKVLAKTMPGTTSATSHNNNGSEDDLLLGPGFDHHKVAQDIFRWGLS